MPDQLNKQTLINLLIDSPLREPIKINLIDIVNNTTEPDLPKVYSTIVKELEIFQKATERRMKLADETIAKLGGTAATPSPDALSTPAPTTPAMTSSPTPVAPTPSLPPLDLPPLPPAPTNPAPTPSATPTAPLSVPPLDLPPLPSTSPQPTPTTEPTPTLASPTPTTTLPMPEPLGGPATVSPSSDEDALAEIQKELESLKAGVTADATPTPPAPQV